MKLIKWIKQLYFDFKRVKVMRTKTELELKIEEAEQKHRETGKRYHVVPNSSDELMVVDNRLIDVYNRTVKKKGGKPITIADLLKMSYYSTK